MPTLCRQHRASREDEEKESVEPDGCAITSRPQKSAKQREIDCETKRCDPAILREGERSADTAEKFR